MGNSGRYLLAILLFIALPVYQLSAQDKPSDERYETAWNSLGFRSIGPAFTSGRIADFAVNPDNYSEFYNGNCR